MGNYATYTSWLSLTQSSSLIPGFTSTIADTATVDGQITRAEGFVNSFIGRQYNPSDVATAPTIQMITEDVTSYRLFKNFVYNYPEGLASTIRENINSDYQTALAMLEQLCEGKMELHDSAGNLINRRDLSNRFYINSSNYAPTFNVDSTLNWRVSPKRLDDTWDERENDQ